MSGLFWEYKEYCENQPTYIFKIQSEQTLRIWEPSHKQLALNELWLRASSCFLNRFLLIHIFHFSNNNPVLVFSDVKSSLPGRILNMNENAAKYLMV